MLRLADVTGVRRCRPARGFDGGDSLGEGLLTTTGDRHASTQPREQLCGRATDAGATARDERRTTSK